MAAPLRFEATDRRRLGLPTRPGGSPKSLVSRLILALQVLGFKKFTRTVNGGGRKSTKRPT
jgi:hypothetical protein